MMKLSVKALWSDKKKRIILIAVIVACLLVAIVSFVVTGQISNSGKDFYEQFQPGTNAEAVLKKLDQQDLNFEIKEGSHLTVVVRQQRTTRGTGLTTMQGLPAGPDSAVFFYFDGSDKLEQITASIYPRAMDYHSSEDEVETWRDILLSTLDEKYGDHYQLVEDGSFRWDTKTWHVICDVDHPQVLGFEVSFLDLG